MAITEARKRANRKYNEKAYDRIEITVKKGRREEIKAYAESKGMSTNSYINKLIDDDMGESKESGESDDTN